MDMTEASKPIRTDSIPPLPGKLGDPIADELVVIRHDVEAREDKPQADDLDAVAADRPHAIGEISGLGPPPRLAMRKHQHAIPLPQRGDLRQRRMLGGEPPPWIP
jgi:hypothetical protein